MRRPRLDLNLLIALRALLAERSVTRAAESMHLSQPAMSATLARLREYFDDALIAPVGRRMELTPLGHSLQEPINDVLVRIDATLQTVPMFDARTSRRRFVIVASDYVFSVLLPTVIERVSEIAPDVCLRIVSPTEGVASRLETGEVDLLLVPERFASADHPSLRLFEDDHCLVVDAAHPTIGDSVDLPTYLAARHVTYSHNPRPYFDIWFERMHDEPRRIDLTLHGFKHVAQVLPSTTRVAVLLNRVARQMCPAFGLRMAKLGFDSPILTIVMQWHQYRDLDPGLQWLRDVVVAEAGRLPPLEAIRLS